MVTQNTDTATGAQVILNELLRTLIDTGALSKEDVRGIVERSKAILSGPTASSELNLGE